MAVNMKIKTLISQYVSADYIKTGKIKAFVTMILGFIVTAAKVVFGIIIKSLIWAYSGVYTLCLSVSNLIFVRTANGEVPERKRVNGVLAISVILLVAAVLFDECAMLKQFSGEGGVQYPVVVVVVASIYFVAAYVFAIIGLFAARKHKDLNFFALKVIGISGALMNMVLLQRMILSCLNIAPEVVSSVNSVFSYFIGGCLTVAAIILLVKCGVYKRKLKNIEKDGEKDAG